MIVEVDDDSIGFACSFFCIPKKTGEFRPIVNLKPANQCIRYEPFQMEDLETVRFLVREGNWFVKLDLKDAYLTALVQKFYQKYRRFSWRERVSQFPCMVFGLSPATIIFTKRLKVVTATLRR